LLYLDLINNHLEIGLAPAPEPQFVGHKIRVVKSFNPPWYSKIYYYHNRGKRRLFEKSLERLISLKDSDFNERNYKFNYDFSFRYIIYSRFIEGYTEEGYHVVPNNEVRYFFGLEPALEEED
jgi:hypothetical protein